jgi:porin
MGIGENDDGNNYQYYALQLGYTPETSLGEGHYRVLVEATSRDFLDPEGENKEQKSAMFLSFDQEFGEIIGGWLRIGRQDDSAAIDFESLYYGGINISGKLWAREHDNIGIGSAYLDGGNKNIDNSKVAEVYYRFVLNDIFAATLDVQYMRDKLNGSESLDGFIYGLRITAEF